MPVSALSHLIPEARKIADLDDAQRIDAIQRDRWVNYPRATEALERLERLLQTPKRERMPCMVMHGDSNIGKTLIIAKFMRGHPPSFDASRCAEQRDIIAMQMRRHPISTGSTRRCCTSWTRHSARGRVSRPLSGWRGVC